MTDNSSSSAIDETLEFQPKFSSDGLITAMIVDAETGSPLMLAHMNQEALRRTIESGKAHFFSRSRNKIWLKGESSGNVLEIEEILTDCDQDALWIRARVTGHGAACHTGRQSCFYRRVILGAAPEKLEPTGAKPLFDPAEIYGD